MTKIGIFYGSTTGTTAEVAKKIAAQLGVAAADVHDVASTAPSAVAPYDVIILGASTWGDGDMQDDMHDFIDGLEATALMDKKIALFGCGDDTMSDTFCNAVGDMFKALRPTGATFIGDFNADGYSFEHTRANVDGKIVGLLIDNTNHVQITDLRIRTWCDEIKKQI